MTLQMVKSPLAQLSEENLLTLVQARDEAAFEELMSRNSSSSLRLAVSILRNRQEAEDAVQDSYWNAWRAVGNFQRDSKFGTWMSRIVTNQCLMRLRKGRRASFLSLDDPPAEGIAPVQITDQAPGPEGELHHKELISILHQEAAKLPPLLRDVLTLRDFSDLPLAEVASRLGIRMEAAKTRLMRARTELTRRVQKRQGAAGRESLAQDELAALPAG